MRKPDDFYIIRIWPPYSDTAYVKVWSTGSGFLGMIVCFTGLKERGSAGCIQPSKADRTQGR